MFRITNIHIYKDCQYRNNLEEGDYRFNSVEIENFYGENIDLYAIVGMNGSGKSSLIDMSIRVMNNFAAVLLKDEHRAAAEQLRFVLGVHADVHYVVSGGNQLMDQRVIHCDNRRVWLETQNEIWWLSDEKLLGHSTSNDARYLALKSQCGTKFQDLSSEVEMWQRNGVANMIFYTIVTNYSLLGYLSPDYENEKCLRYGSYRQINSKGKFVQKDGKDVIVKDWIESGNWLDSLFHKNDGYMCPIVLNPYRHRAQFDMDNETDLTVQRLMSILICEDRNNSILENYELDTIKFKLKKNLWGKFSDEQLAGCRSEKQRLSLFKDRALTNGTYAYFILKFLKCDVSLDMDDILWYTALYIVYKALSIASKYPSYTSIFIDSGNIDNAFAYLPNQGKVMVVQKLANMINDYHSHIEFKIHQAIEFFQWGKVNKQKLIALGSDFSYRKYKDCRNLPNYKMEELDACMETLPPAIFSSSIYLQRTILKEDGNTKKEKRIPLNRLSSGERQFLYQITTIVYHLHNIRSVTERNIRYRNINLVMDEIEICYHPDFQRKFIMRLLNMLKVLKFNEYFHINILLTTHSPFILSDIPQQNILYMKDGKRIDVNLNPFGENINEILSHGFFLENGFMGYFVEEKINSLVGYLLGENNNWTQNSASKMISQIGDEIICSQLRDLLKKKISQKSPEDYKNWLLGELQQFNKK